MSNALSKVFPVNDDSVGLASHTVKEHAESLFERISFFSLLKSNSELLMDSLPVELSYVVLLIN